MREHYEHLLFDLGDDATVQKFAKQFASGDVSNSSGFASSQNPRLIELLAPVMFREEGWVAEGWSLAPSFATPGLILTILGTTPDFNSEVINWARRFPANRRTLHTVEAVVKDYHDRREVMREWWRNNEQHFKERNYKAVQPGRDLDPEDDPELETVPLR